MQISPAVMLFHPGDLKFLLDWAEQTGFHNVSLDQNQFCAVLEMGWLIILGSLHQPFPISDMNE